MNSSRVFSLRIGADIKLGECTNDCAYCFAHKNFRNSGSFSGSDKTSKRESITSIANAINRGYVETMNSYWIENRYPVCISNHSDFCANPDKEYVRDVIKLLKSAGFPIYIETKGTSDKSDIDFLLKYLDPARDTIYCTIEFSPEHDLSGSISNAPAIKDRISFVKQFQNSGFYVDIGINPFIRCMITEEDAIRIIDSTRHEKTCYMTQALHFNSQTWKKTQFTDAPIDFEKIIDHCENEGAVLGVSGYNSPKAFEMRIRQKNFAETMRNQKISGSDFAQIAIDGYRRSYKRDGENGEDDGKMWYGFVSPSRMVELLEEKQKIPEFLVDRKEIYSRESNYFSYGLPEKFSYKEYLKFCVKHAFEVARYSYLLKFTNTATNETGLIYPFQKIIEEVSK